jgi:chorismate synthase
LRFLNAGESHGKGTVTIVEGVPAGLRVSGEEIEGELARRRLGYGRGPRMEIEKDKVAILSGVRRGYTLGSPIAIWVENLDYPRWERVMSPESTPEDIEGAVTKPRPGHVDLAGALKYSTRDLRDVLERASARETLGRACAAAIARIFLKEFGIEIISHVLSVGEEEAKLDRLPLPSEREAIDGSPLRCLDGEATLRMVSLIEKARERGDTLGGVFEVLAYGVPPGLGSHVHWDRRLDGLLAQAVMSIQAVKGVEIGEGYRLAASWGSEAVDLIDYQEGRGFYRTSNRAGGIEGGISNGEVIRVRAAMKPIPTLGRPAPTVDIASKERVEALVERADVCAVPAAAVVAESMVAWVIADAFLQKFGGDHLEEVGKRYFQYLEEVRRF